MTRATIATVADPNRRRASSSSSVNACATNQHPPGVPLFRLPLGGVLFELAVEQVLGHLRTPAGGGQGQVEHQGQVQRVRANRQASCRMRSLRMRSTPTPTSRISDCTEMWLTVWRKRLPLSSLAAERGRSPPTRAGTPEVDAHCVPQRPGRGHEVADELGSRIRQEDRFDATLDAVLGVLPSYTQLGMAALLPHDRIGHSAGGDPVVVDGQRSDGTPNLSRVLAAVGGTAVQAEDVFALTREGLRDLYQRHQVLYGYHNRIDATGDKAGTERQTVEAAAETVRELVDLVKRLANANATNIVVTADHGFLFQDTALASSFYLSTLPRGADIKVTNRRYVPDRGLQDDPAFTSFTAAWTATWTCRSRSRCTASGSPAPARASCTAGRPCRRSWSRC